MPEGTCFGPRFWITTRAGANWLGTFPAPGIEVAEPALNRNPATEPPPPADFLRWRGLLGFGRRPSSSLSKNTPGEGTGPTERVSSGEIPIGRRAPTRFFRSGVFQTALRRKRR